MPKAKTIDALLDAGATAPSSALNVATSATKPTERPHISNTKHDHVDLNTGPESVGVNVTIKADQDARHKDRKLDNTNSEASRSRRDGDKSRSDGADANTPGDKTGNRELLMNARKATSKVSVGRDKQVETADTIRAKAYESNGGATDDKSHGKSGIDTGSTGLPTLDTRRAEVNQTQRDRPAKTSAEDLRGRPQRQAKQTALGKLKAKHGKIGSDVEDTTDDSQDDGSMVFVLNRPAKKATDRNQRTQHLPTPVTNGNVAKQTTETKPHGNVKSVKQQQKKATASAKKPLKQTAACDKPAPSEQAGKLSKTVAGKEKARPSTEKISTRSPPDHRRTSTITASHSEQQETRRSPSPRRPGALKRPARPFSRGRRSQRQAPYEFPENTPGTKKKGRSVSRASKVPVARAAPARQRMQSESVKERLDHAGQSLQPQSVSKQPYPKIAEPRGRLQKLSVARHKNDSLRAPSGVQSRDITQQPESQIPPRARSRHTEDGQSHNLATRDRQVAAREKPGSSQAQAIMIEQDSRSELSSSPSPRGPTNTLSKATAKASSRGSQARRPQTPALMPSSPPVSSKGSIYTLAKEKPTIIAFNRQGPRNQGLSSAVKDPGSAASSKVFSDYKSAKAGTPKGYAKANELAAQPFPLSSQTTRGPTTQSKHTVEPNNVAKDGESASRNFTKSRETTALTHILPGSSKVINQLGQEIQDDDFAVIDEFEGTTLVNDSEQAEPVPTQPTASQVAMPPPNIVKRGKKESKTASAPVQLPEKTFVKCGSNKDTRRPVPAEKPVDVSKVKGPSDPVSIDQASTHLVGDKSQNPASESKTARTLPADNASRRKLTVGQTIAQQSQQTRKRDLTEPQAGSPAKRPRVSQESMLTAPDAKLTHAHEVSESQRAHVIDPTNRVDRRKSRPGRRSTQASQGVDLLGSPYPKDFEVPIQTTALEVFSQQAALSSDQTERPDAAPTGRLDLKAVPRMLPTTKVGLVSSNGKPVPAAPCGSSKAVTRIASGPLAEQLLAVRPVHTSEDNPFTSSRERESSAGHGLIATKFREALRQRGIDLNDRPSVVSDDERDTGPVDDAERTLFEAIDESGQANRDVVGSPGVSEASSANSLDTAGKVLEDVGDWRNSLKPHQTHLFDSLVIAAHKLVRHMVDHETADRTMVADYRRRGEIIVAELQRAHAKEYQQYTQNVHDWKKQAADELAAHGRKLKQSMRDAEKVRAERKKARLARGGFDGMLEELVAELD